MDLIAGESLAGSSLPSGGTPSRQGGRCCLSNLSAEQKRKHRAVQLAEAKRRERLRRASIGDRIITITLTAGEANILEDLMKRQNGPVEGFARRALMLGAVFAANAGTRKGRKVKGNTQAAAIRGSIDDMSTR